MYGFEWRIEESRAEAQRAVELAPNDAKNLTELALAQGLSGQPQEALRSMEGSLRFNPRGVSLCLVAYLPPTPG